MDEYDWQHEQFKRQREKDVASQQELDKLRAENYRLKAALEEVGVGDFRFGWLKEAEELWVSRASENPPDSEVVRWAARTMELVRCMLLARAVADGEWVRP